MGYNLEQGVTFHDREYEDKTEPSQEKYADIAKSHLVGFVWLEEFLKLYNGSWLIFSF